MPFEYVTFRIEYDHRASSIPYFTGHGGVTPPGGATGAPGSVVTLPDGTTWAPDLSYVEDRLTVALMVRL